MPNIYTYCADKIKTAWRNFFASAPGVMRLVVLSTGFDDTLSSQYAQAAKAYPHSVAVIGLNITACPKLVQVYKLQRIPCVLVFKNKTLKEIWQVSEDASVNVNQAVSRLSALLNRAPALTRTEATRSTRTTLPARAVPATIVRTAAPAPVVPASDLGATSYNANTAKDEVYRLINRERALENQRRAARGLAPMPLVKPNAQLDKVAAYHAGNMARYGFYAHTDPQGHGPADRLQLLVSRGVIPQVNWRAIGENIDKDDTSPQMVMNSWMGSAGHRENILRPNFTDVGIAVDWPTKHWVQVFAQVAS